MHTKRIFKFFRNTVSIALAVSMLLGDIGASLGTVYASESTQVPQGEERIIEVSEEEVNSSSYGLVDDIQDGAILHCFDWKYTDIIEELPNIAKAGFTSVQTSPAQQGCGGDIWYTLYQPLGFWIGSDKLGSKDELQRLCTEAEKYGIKVIVDVVANHLAGDHTNIDGELKPDEYWHNSNYNTDGSNGKQKIDWTNRWQVTHGDIGMPDLNTEHSTVQNKVLNYINELKGIGVDGIRWDTTKHISLPSEGCDFWAKVTKTGLYNYGEILEGPMDPTNGVYTDEAKRLMKEYTDYLSVTDNGYGNALTGNFRDGKVYTENGRWTGMGVSADKLVYWGESHDTYANDELEGGWTKYIDQNVIDRAYAIAAARKDATVLYYSRPYEKQKTSIKSGVKGSTHFTAPEVAAVNHFKNAVVDEKEYYVPDQNAGAIAVCRESGAVIAKAQGSGQVTIANGGGTTKPGTYVDEVSGSTWTVTSTTISGSVGSSGIAVIYDKQLPAPEISASVADGTSFTTNTLDVTFTVENATSATYSVNGGAAVSFSGSKTITIGENINYGNDITVKVVATNAKETIEKTFTYTKEGTETPTDTPTPTVIVNEPSVVASMESGASFTTETAEVKLTLQNAEKGTYTVDDGPVKEFTGSVNVVIGKGKIADSDVTIKTTATGKGKTVEKTFTYRKEFLYENAVNAAAEDVEEVAVNAAPDTTYATNPKGQVGAKKTIKSAADFDESMIIAQGVANDDPAIFKGPHEAPKYDLYAMYGAWDDTNLYIGIQYTNVIDVACSDQEAPQTDRGKPYSEDGDIPQMLVFDTGTGDYTDGTTNDTKQSTAWSIDVKYSGAAKVDKIFLYSPKKSIVNQALFPVANGIVDYSQVVKSGYHYFDASKGQTYDQYAIPGTAITWEDGFFGSAMYGINSNGYSGYKPADLESSSSNWVNFLDEGHNTKYDTFSVITMPLSSLGVTADDMQSKGIGVMSIASYGASGIGSLPMDMTMLDNACEAFSQDDSTSHEKEDSDLVTTALARVGGKADITITPTKPATPTTLPIVTDTPTPTGVIGGNMAVNFGADRSAPQYNTTALNVKAIVTGGTAPYNYEFFVDGQSVQNSASDTYVWQNGTAGARKIKVVVTDNTGKTVTCEKDYDLEENGAIDTPTPTVTVDPTPSVDPTPTNTVTPTPTSTVTPIPVPGKLAISMFKVSAMNNVGDEVVLTAEATNTTGTPLYMFTYVLDNAEEVVIQNYSESNTAKFTVEAAGKYTLKVYVVDADDEVVASSEAGQFTVDGAITTATPTPVNTATPTPTNAPINTATPAPTNTVTPQPTNGAQVTGTPEVGAAIYDSKSNAEYKVTAVGSKKTVTYVSGKSTATSITIPDTIKIGGITYKVTKIADNAFKNNKKVKTVTIGKNVTSIGKSAFQGCTALQKVKKGSNVQTIGDKAFYGCKKLSSITLSSKLTTIGKYAFYKCTSLKKITIPSKVKKIGAKAFYGCKNLKTITIKTKKLTSKNLGSKAFKGIYSKATIKVPSSKVTAYKKLLKSKGVSSKAKVKKY